MGKHGRVRKRRRRKAAVAKRPPIRASDEAFATRLARQENERRRRAHLQARVGTAIEHRIAGRLRS